MRWDPVFKPSTRQFPWSTDLLLSRGVSDVKPHEAAAVGAKPS